MQQHKIKVQTYEWPKRFLHDFAFNYNRKLLHLILNYTLITTIRFRFSFLAPFPMINESSIL